MRSGVLGAELPSRTFWHGRRSSGFSTSDRRLSRTFSTCPSQVASSSCARSIGSSLTVSARHARRGRCPKCKDACCSDSRGRVRGPGPDCSPVKAAKRLSLHLTLLGKTSFLLFFLIQCLSREETVLFTSPLGATYLFDKDGIVTTRTSQFRCFAHVPDDVPDPSQRLWSLVDCSQSKEPTSSSVTYGARQLFFVAAARPDLSHCGDLKGRFNVREWWMSHWTENELRAL